MAKQDKRPLEEIFGTARRGTERRPARPLEEIFGLRKDLKEPVSAAAAAMAPDSELRAMSDAGDVPATDSVPVRTPRFLGEKKLAFLEQSQRMMDGWLDEQPAATAETGGVSWTDPSSDVDAAQPVTEAPAEKTVGKMPAERFDAGSLLNPAAVRSGVLLDPQQGGKPAAGDVALPTGTVLRKSDRDMDDFFRRQVVPGIDTVQAKADERARKVLTEQGEARNRRWLEHFNIDPQGDFVADAIQTDALSRRERGPARIVEDVLSEIDPDAANAYIAGHLADDEEFARASERLQQVLPPAGEVTDKEIEQLQAALTPAQRRQFDKAVEAEQKLLAGEQKAFQQAADAAWRRQALQLQQGIADRLVEEMARRNMPKSELDALGRIALDASIPGMLAELAVSNATGGDKALHARIMQRAMEKYHPALATRIGGEVAGLLLSGPVFSAGGAMGKAGAAGLRRIAERSVMKRLMERGITAGAEGVARRLVARNTAQRLAQGAITSGTTLATYDAVATPLALAAAGEKPGMGDVFGAAGRGFATGALLPGIGMATERIADAAGSRLGRYAAEAGGFAAENAAFVGMGTLYDGIRTGDWGSSEQLAGDFAHSVGVLGIMKSIGALKRGRAKNPGFYDKVIAETEFTPEEVEALGRAGVDGRSYKRAVFDLLNAKPTEAGHAVAERAAERLGSRYTDIMRSGEVPVSAKAKLMFLVEGRIPERLPLTTDVRRTVGEDGRTTVELLDPAGNLVQRRTFSTEKAAEAFERESAGMREINSIQYYEAVIDRAQSLDEASAAYAAERGVQVEAVKEEVRKAAAGKPHDRETVRRVAELAGQAGSGTVDVPGMLVEQVVRKYGLGEDGLERALTRKESARTPEQRAAVAEYAARLKEVATQELQPERTGEQQAEHRLMQVAEEAIERTKNRDDEVVYTATMRDGRQVNIIKGAGLSYDPETGEVDAAQSEPTVVVRYDDGTMRQVSVREIDMIVEAVRAEDARTQALDAIREQLEAAARDEALADAAGSGGMIALKDGRIGAVEGVNEDGSFSIALADGEGRIVVEQVAAGDIAGPVEDAQTSETVRPADDDPLLGRPLTDEEAAQVVERMEAAAVPAPQVELTPENWDAAFGEDGKVQTPIGEVKMGENQYLKMLKNDRGRQFGMVKPTLTDPDIVIEEGSEAMEGITERPSSYLFIKTFLKPDGYVVRFFTSVTVSREGKEVVVSNHIVTEKALGKKLLEGRLIYKKEISPAISSDEHLTETRTGLPDLLPTQADDTLVEDKDTTSIPEKQGRNDSLIGRALTDEDAAQVVERMEAAAVPAPQVELTPENWDAAFGDDGKVQTPIGEVKMGEHQYLKMAREGRNTKFGMIKPTLTDPFVVVEEKSRSKEGQVTERPSSFVFVKPFVDGNGKRNYLFTSVTIRRDGQEVVVSNQEKETGRIKRMLKEGRLAYIKMATLPSGAVSPAQGDQSAVPHGATLENKDTTSIPEKQVAGADIPRLKDGRPDFNAMPSGMLAAELSETLGHDRAVERLQAARGANGKKMEKLRKALEGMGDLNNAMAAELRLGEMLREDARLAGALEELGAAEEQEAETNASETFSQEIERLFPEGLPNVRARVLADIARGQRFVWNDSPDGTKRGVARELGFTGNESERRARFGILGSERTGAKSVSRYVHELWQDSNGYAFDMDDAQLRDEVIDVLLGTPTRMAAMEQLRDMAVRSAEDAAVPRDAEDAAARETYEETQKSLRRSENYGTFAEGETQPEMYGREFNKNHGRGFSAGTDTGIGMVDDPAGGVARAGDRSDIRVFEEGLAASYREHSDGSERDRREAESERLVAVAKENGLYITEEQLSGFGKKQPGKTSESVVYIDRQNGKVYKSKNPYAKAAIKGNAPEDAIYEHIVHNLLFPETRYEFEGISDYLGDVRIVLSQDFVNAVNLPTQQQIDAELARHGLLPEDRYSYGNELVSVTDVEGDNVLAGYDGRLYFIDPIIRLKKPAREVIAELERHEPARRGDGPDDRTDDWLDSDVPFSVRRESAAAPAGVSPERWNVIVEQLRRAVGAENVVTDPEQVRRVYYEITEHGKVLGPEDMQRSIVADRTLVGVHNLTEDNILHAFRMGGLANPSLAVIDAAGGGFDDFGDITLLAPRGLIDKSTGKNIGTFGADIYSPRYPQVERLYGDKLEQFAKELHSFVEQRFDANHPVAKRYVRSNSYLRPQYALNGERALKREPFMQAYYAERVLGETVPRNATAEQIDALIPDAAAYYQWFNDTFTALAEKEVIPNGVTLTGRRRYLDHTLENVSRYMKAQGRNGSEGYNYGLGTLRSHFAPKFTTLKQIRSAKKRLQTAEEFIETKRAFEDEYDALVRELSHAATDSESIESSDIRLASVLMSKHPEAELQRDGYHPNEELLHRIRTFREALAQMPTEYFETKFERPVTLNEFAGAVVPDDLSPEVADALRMSGIRHIETYDPSVDGARKRALEKLADALDTESGIYFMRTPEGEVYGFTVGDVIYLDSSRMNAATPMHEYTELWSQIVAREQPDLWMRGVELLKRTETWKEVNADPNYRHLSQQLRASETLSRLSATIFEEKQAGIAEDDGLIGRLRDWLREFWSALKATFSKWTKRELDSLTAEDVARMPVRDFLEGIDLSRYASESGAEIRFARDFNERRVTSLERLENKRAALVADRENIANFEEQLAAVDAEIEAYNGVDHVAATYREDGSGAESKAHLHAVEDAVYDIVRKERVEGVQVDVVQSPDALLDYARSRNWAREDIEEIELGILNRGYYSVGNITVLASKIKNHKMATGVFWHERTHGVTDDVCTPDRLAQAAAQAGRELLDRALVERGYTSDLWPLERQADEYISRAVEILAKKGLLNDYLASQETDMEKIGMYLAERSVPVMLRDCILDDCKYIKDQKYGTEEGILLRAGDISRAATITADKAQSDRHNRTAVEADEGVDGDGDVALRRGFSGAERGSAAEDNEGGVRAADAVGVHSARGGDLEQDSVPDLTRQQRLIADLRHAVRETKASTRAVAQIVSRRVREEVGRELVDVMGKREFDAIVRQIEEATARQEVEKPLRRIAEVVVDIRIKRLQKAVDDFLRLKVQGEGPRGVSVAKVVDDRTRRMFEIFRRNLDRPAAEVAEELREAEDTDRLYDMDAVSALEAYQEALRYRREVDEIEREADALRSRNTQLRRERIAANKAGHKELFETLKKQIAYNNELIEALEEERMQTKEHVAGSLKATADILSEKIGYGREILREWQEQEQERRKGIVRKAFADVDDGSRVPVLDRQPGIWTQGYRRTVDFLLSPAYSMDYLLKMISVNAPKGEGALYDHFMRGKDGYVEARGRYWLGYEEFKRLLDEKARKMFGKSYAQVVAESNTPAEATITITNARPGKKDRSVDPHSEEEYNTEQYSPTIGEALYIYMADKMTDGRVKLRRMGIGEGEIGMLAASLPARYVQFADWLQAEFLPGRRKVYNATHLAVFGTQMARIENYVPLKIQKSNVRQEVDGSDADPDTLPSAITGSIIKRTRNNQILNLHTNALDLVLEHGQQMEHWNAFTRVVLDMNALLSSTAFRRTLEARNPGLHRRLKVAAQLAADSYRPQTNDVNRAWIALGKLAASSKIAFRINTALKQVLSYPAFYAYSSDPKFWGLLTKNLVPTTWTKNFRWSIDRIPSFRERWLGRMAGNEKLAQMTAPMLDRWIEKMNRYGMLPNAFVDALTCANGAKAVYDFRRAEYLERGRDESEADRLARIDAAVAINSTQQSSEGMFIGQMQADRDFWSVSLSTFQNSNFAYLRKQLEGIDELFRDAARERTNRAAYYKEQGFTEAEAFDLALAEVTQAKRGALLNIGVFVFVLNLLWGLGNNVWKYLFASETRAEIPEELAKSAFIAPVRNTTVGSLAESFANGYDANPSVLLSDMISFTKRLKRIAEKENPDAWNETAAYLAVQTLSANGLGIDLESFVNMVQGIAGMIRDGADVEDIMRVLNAPQSQAKLLAGKPREGETAEQYRCRMIFTERRIASRLDKKRLDKWSRNYAAYRKAEALGLGTERDRFGNVAVPELKELDAEYEAALKLSGVTASGEMRRDYDWQALPPEQQERWRQRARLAWRIYQQEKELDTVVLFDERYAERMRESMELKREFMEDVERDK